MQLLRQSQLKKGALQSLLKRVHEAKERGLVGEPLYEAVIERAVAYTDLPPAIRAMIWLVLSVDWI